MADQIEPYVPANAGDIIRAADWNQAQIKAREALATHEQKANEALAAHDHAHGDGQPIPREGIAQNAIDGSRIDPNAEVKLKSLELSGPLKVDARDILDEIDKLLASVPGSGERDFAARNLVVDGIYYFLGKDWGNIIPGHGGLLDRANSMVIVIPIAFYFSYLVLGHGITPP